ncbi:MAG: heavy metal translocating P-type ATPase [Candidatus Poseidoniaceae archaeon]|jgi:Cd2+/Zn2+-exporting ATPase|nr:heavy metal translocating P-type ATPase [Candidatus Poseidoniaceae archaeon]
MLDEGDAEEFISLEGVEEVTKQEKKPRKRAKSKPKRKPIKESKIEKADQIVLGDYGGKHKVSWPILDMDCPDCASKAMNALNRLDQVTTSKVSATDGNVILEVDFEKGPLSEASSILRSLGHAPDVEYMEMVGISAEKLAARHSLPVKSLPKLIRRQPGILSVEIDKENRILLQIVSEKQLELNDVIMESLDSMTGEKVVLKETISKRITLGQWRMIGSGFSLLMLALIIILEIFESNSMVIGIFGLLGVFAGGTRMVRQAFASIINRQLSFQVLTALAVIGASYLQAWEEALMVIILVSWTEHMKDEALINARTAMQGGLDRLPKIARRMKTVTSSPFTIVSGNKSLTMAPVDIESRFEEVPIELIMKGDKIEIRSGELIPADGTIVSGTGSVNRAPLTGESVPVDVAEGDQLQAGLTLARGPVTIVVDAVGDDTRLSGLIEAVHSYRERPTRLQGMLENFTGVWVPLVLFGAIFVWLINPSQDWKIILILWVVACPCALLLASPVPHAAALSQASKSGVIARGGDILESLSKVNLALLDKTGTLTSGRPRLGEMVLARGRRRDAALALAAGIESSSNHPYAQTIIEAAKAENLSKTKVTNLKDGEAGVYGKVGKSKVAMIRASEEVVKGKLLEALSAAKEAGHGASILLKDDRPVALFTFIHDDLREGAEDLIKSLYATHIEVEMLSGDNQEAVNILAENIGIRKSAAFGEMSPEDKVNWVERRSDTHVTMMVGDGFNDAAAMAAADIGVAIGAGESVNLEAADILIPSDNPLLLADIVKLAKRTHSVLTWNIIYSVVITMILVYAALAGINDNLAIGVLVHELSVIGVIINGARLSGAGGTFALVGEIMKSIYVGTRDSFTTLLSRN